MGIFLSCFSAVDICNSTAFFPNLLHEILQSGVSTISPFLAYILYFILSYYTRCFLSTTYHIFLNNSTQLSDIFCFCETVAKSDSLYFGCLDSNSYLVQIVNFILLLFGSYES